MYALCINNTKNNNIYKYYINKANNDKIYPYLLNTYSSLKNKELMPLNNGLTKESKFLDIIAMLEDYTY